MKKRIASVVAAALALGACAPLAACGSGDPSEVYYSFDEEGGYTAEEDVSGDDTKIYYNFSAENQDKLFKTANEPLRRKGVKGNALYFDGYSTYLKNSEYVTPKTAVTLSAWVAPRVFENHDQYNSYGEGYTRLTSVINQGDINLCEGFCLGYGRLGLWGVQLALKCPELDEELVVGYYDPINTLELYEWSHICATFDSATGYIGLYFNGKVAYEGIFPDYVGATIIAPSGEPLYIGRYCAPYEEQGVETQYVAGLLDEVRIKNEVTSPAEAKELFDEDAPNGIPKLDFKDVGLDSTLFADDRYRPQYHAIPPALWMNEPHAPVYYKGKYHVFYQHNPAGPYFRQLRWGHIVSDDMIHWEYVRDAVVPNGRVCPEGVWTGGATIGPDGVPWLVITAGTNKVGGGGSGQNIAYAHPADENDPYLKEWIVEDQVVITQPSNGSEGEVNEFRDPFIWCDEGVYYMLVSTSIPGRGGSANVYVSENMRDWESMGYLCDLNVPTSVQGDHWECVTLLPISNANTHQTKYVMFVCPQFKGGDTTVECLYWIGSFDKQSGTFTPDGGNDALPEMFDYGASSVIGQNGLCYRTEEQIENGLSYEQGRSIMIAISQGTKSVAHNSTAGWAHNFMMAVELSLSDDGTEVVRTPIAELDSVRQGNALYSYEGSGVSADALNEAIASLKGDTLEIDATFTVKAGTARAGIDVRYNLNEVDGVTEYTRILFGDDYCKIDGGKSTALDLDYIKYADGKEWNSGTTEYSVKILLDRSMLEVYINGVMTMTSRIYPKYGNSDHVHIYESEEGAISFTSFSVYRMGSAYSKTLTAPYYGNVGNLGNKV